MVIVRMRIVVSLHSRKTDGGSEGSSEKDEWGGLWAAGTGWYFEGPMKIMEVSQDDGTQYAQHAGETVLWFGSTACGGIKPVIKDQLYRKNGAIFSVISLCRRKVKPGR
ncbi:hypothetical protein DPMN_100332 [Dreissena polymorpha]|uniref:Uncharacterized protein n=1 Tax=Dreissena polymorpha TaxID=45954 RepID=A0A9D4LH56_DREPO|nr:hypothetical protein DPMN_100332 [Dreissena polymorpha]